MIGILDYGAGNLTSVRLAFGRLGVEASLVRDASEWQSGMTHLVFPGVGSAASGMAGVCERGFDGLMRDWLSRGRPALAICLGEQLIFGRSEEDGGVAGLGLVPGRVIPFAFPAESHVKVPHMGWNGVSFPQAHPVLAGLADGEAFYFVHSYYAAPDASSDVAGVTEYAGCRFTSMVAHGSLFATQCHPERSGEAGLRLLRNFVAWDGRVASEVEGE